MARPERDDLTTRPPVAPSGRTLARFDRPRGKSTTLMVVADAHLSQTAYGTLKCFHRTKQRLEMAFADAHRLEVDGVAVAGDLTRDGTAEEYAFADELLSIAPRPTVVVPGNHDVSTDGPVETGREFAARLDGPTYPTTRTVAGVEVTGLDTTKTVADDPISGTVSADALQSLDTLSSATPRIAVMHHPLATVPGHFESSLPTDAYRVQNPDRAAETLQSAGADLVISGHVHWPYAESYRDLNVVGAPSTASFPPAYLLVHVDRHGTTVEMVPLAGEAGLSEAYEFAMADDYRGEAIRQAVTDGYFEGLPVVDERDGSAPVIEAASVGTRLASGSESR